MRILALDVGTKTIGVAVSDELKITANGVKTIQRKNESEDIKQLRSIVAEYNPEKIVVGLPYRIDGTLGERGKNIEKFAKKVESKLKLPVEFWDESFSTVNAEKALIEGNVSRKKRKKVIDKMAAVVILQDYLRNTV